MGALMLRLVLSLGVVLALMMGAAAFMRRGRGFGFGGGARRRPVPLEVLTRHALGRRASIVVVRAGQRGLVLGVTDQHVSLLTEAAADDFQVTEPDAPGTASPLSGPAARTAWTTFVESLRDRTARRT